MGVRATLRKTRERGAVMVEAALLMPLLLLLSAGVVDMGFLIDHDLTVASATTAGTRAGARAGNVASADYQILQAVESAESKLAPGSVRQIIIYRADSPDADVPRACYSGSSIVYHCNTYDRADLGGHASSFVTESGWAPATRRTGASGEADFIGVHLVTDHDYIIGIFGESRSIAETVVMRIDPRNRGSDDVIIPPAPPATTTTTTTTTTTVPTTTTTRPTTTTTRPTTTMPGSPTTTRPTTTTTRPTTTAPTTTRPPTTFPVPTTEVDPF